MIAYEIGAVMYLTHPGAVETIGAHRMVVRMFESLGGVLLHAPTFLLAAILLVWHLLLRDSWKVKPSVLLGMAFESCLWTLPVLVLGLLADATVNMGGSAPAALADGVANIRDQPWQARATLSIGAGLYEELLFRLVLLTVLHLVLVDVLKMDNRWGSTLAVVAAGVLFALYHDLPEAGRPRLIVFAFYTLVGTYFGALFLLRGFGVVVAVHAMYDLVVLVALRGSTPEGT
jgi:membrane protease YdiL (CAAX protease family)